MKRTLLVLAVAAAGAAVALWATRGGKQRATIVVGTVGVPAPGSGEIVVPFFGTSATDRPVARRLAVFRRPARPSDRWPDSFLAGAAQDAFYYEDGGLLLGRSRRVLAGPMSIFAAPTRQGAVCYRSVSEERGCEEELSGGYDFQFMATGKRTAVFGLLADGVRVAASAGGKRLRVHLGENAYLVVLPRPFPRRGRLAFRRADGTDVVVLVPARSSGLRFVIRGANQVGCAQRAETSSPTPFDDPRFVGRRYRIVVGPLEVRGVRAYASHRVFARYLGRDGYYHAKAALLVKARRSLELTVRGTDPRPVRLAYGTGKPGATLLVKSCAANTPARSRPGVVGSGTVFTGTFEVPVAECVRLRVTNRATGRVLQTRLPFGHRCS